MRRGPVRVSLTLALAAPAVLALTGCGGTARRDDIRCPAATSGSALMLGENAQAIGGDVTALGHGGENEVSEVAAAVRHRHPDASRAAIVDYIDAAYCPAIDRDPALDKAGKRQKMDAFDARVNRIVT